ncbi:MAG: hypothetical protein M0Q51_11920 [Bacteroidales bacterium]|nr:hypothetical protein [Bacteroidales bacterium]
MPVGPGARPIVAMDIDSDGFIYIVSAYDSGSDDEHNVGIIRLLPEMP